MLYAGKCVNYNENILRKEKLNIKAYKGPSNAANIKLTLELAMAYIMSIEPIVN